MSNSLIPYIFNSCWFISESSVNGLLPLVKTLIKGNNIQQDYSEERLKHKAYVMVGGPSMAAKKDSSPGDAQDKGSIAVIPVMDVITRDDQFCGPTGTKTKLAYLDQAGQNPNIDAVILLIDSPGGESFAMFEFSKAIEEFKTKYEKPIVAFVESMAASAAYGIASQCDKIICLDTHTVVGSIGTYITVIDQKKSLEAEGIFIEKIYAEDSSNKNIEWRAALNGDKKPMLKMLKTYNDRFLSIVKSGRPDVKTTDKGNPLTGATVFAMDGIEMGLIDEIGNLNTAIQHCIKLSNNYSPIQNNMKIPFKSTWAAIALMFASKVDGDDLTEADVELMNTELTNRQASIDQLVAAVSEKETAIATLTQQLADATSGNDTLQAALTTTEAELATVKEELAKRPGTAATNPGANTEIIEDPIPSKAGSDPVNQIAKEMLK